MSLPVTYFQEIFQKQLRDSGFSEVMGSILRELFSVLKSFGLVEFMKFIIFSFSLKWQ